MAIFKLAAIAFAAFALSACTQEQGEKFPKGDPVRKLNSEMRGDIVPNNVIMAEVGEYYWAQFVLSNFRENVKNDIPGAIAEIPLNEDCIFKAPEENERLAHVQISFAGIKSPVYMFSEAYVEGRAESFIKYYVKNNGKIPSPKRNGRTRPSSPLYAGGLSPKIVNVVVTDREKPVYLVLTSQGNTIWNIIRHKKAKISRVALIGWGNVGIANLDDNVPVSALYGTKLRRCNALPRRMPRDNWNFVKHWKKSSSLNEAMEENVQDAEKYSRWFYESFNQDSTFETLGDFKISNVLVGPLPASFEERVPFKSIKGSTLKLTEQDYAFASDVNYFRKTLLDLIVPVATEMAGGSLKNLLPDS